MNKNIDIVTLYKILLDNKNFYLRCIVSFFLISLIYVSTLNNYYKASISLYAAGELDDSSMLGGQYGSLAKNFGLSMMPSSNYYIPDIIDSRSLKKEIVMKQWNNSKYNRQVNLIEYWEIDKPGLFSSFFTAVKNLFISNKFSDVRVSQLNAAIDELDNLIYVDEENSGLIVVSVFMEEPQLSSDIGNYISHYLVDFIKNQQKTFADKSKNFILERMNLAEEDLANSEIKLTEFRKINPLILDNPDLQLDRARLIRSVDVNQNVFITLREQLEIAKIESNKERLYINILDRASPNPLKAKPKRILLIFIITSCGFLIGIFSQILLFNLKNIRAKH